MKISFYSTFMWNLYCGTAILITTNVVWLSQLTARWSKHFQCCQNTRSAISIPRQICSRNQLHSKYVRLCVCLNCCYFLLLSYIFNIRGKHLSKSVPFIDCPLYWFLILYAYLWTQLCDPVTKNLNLFLLKHNQVPSFQMFLHLPWNCEDTFYYIMEWSLFLPHMGNFYQSLVLGKALSPLGK